MHPHGTRALLTPVAAQMGNKGAMVKFNRDLKPFFIQFEAAVRVVFAPQHL